MDAAGKTFGSPPTLPPPEESLSISAPLVGRRRLGGAFAIARHHIRPDPNQPRRSLDTEAQKELNDSVKRLGILQPITVRYIEADAIYQVIAGERRYHAACEAGLEEIPCWVQTPKEQDVLLHQIVENWQRLDMHPYDLADALARLREANDYTQNDLAHETGKSKGEISKLLTLLDLDPAVQKMAREDNTGRISRRHLYAVRALPTEEQLRLIRKTQEEAISAADMEQIVAKRMEALEGHKRRGAPVIHHRFSTSHAMVTVTFRKRDVSSEDILAALDEARLQVSPPPTDSRSPTAR
jgi:ParB family chromosome partitioning protein